MTSAPVIGILGGIGSGKSSVVREIDDIDLLIIDADEIGHVVLQDEKIQNRLQAAFGPSIMNGNQVNRRKLGELVFAPHLNATENRTQLNSIVHPAIRTRIHELIQYGKESAEIVILDASLLLDGNWDQHCDALIFVDANLEIRQSRVQKNRGWEADELPQREKTQVDITTKRTRADYIVDNNGTLKEAVKQMRDILKALLAKKRSQK